MSLGCVYREEEEEEDADAVFFTCLVCYCTVWDGFSKLFSGFSNKLEIG
jgi:hypothetical protein